MIAIWYICVYTIVVTNDDVFYIIKFCLFKYHKQLVFYIFLLLSLIINKGHGLNDFRVSYGENEETRLLGEGFEKVCEQTFASFGLPDGSLWVCK